jgi:hypothetical protein
MQKTSMREIWSLAAAVSLGVSCAGNRQASAGGEVISPRDAGATVVLHVQNLGMAMVELRSVEDGRTKFIGSVGAQDTTSLLMDPLLFPTANLFIAAFANAGGQRIVVGPLAAGIGDRIDLTVQQGLTGSQATVSR